MISQANVEKPKELYRFYKSLGVDNVQFIPLAEFNPDGSRMPFTITAAQYGRFLVEMFDLWGPDRRKMRIRFFDNIAEAVAGMRPGSCTMHETCESHVAGEYNGDTHPRDFFVESRWEQGNCTPRSWGDGGPRTPARPPTSAAVHRQGEHRAASRCAPRSRAQRATRTRWSHRSRHTPLPTRRP